MSLTDHLPPGVKTRIARGEVPPPRRPSDPLDPIRDQRLAIAIAEDAGDFETVAQLNARLLGSIRDGQSSDWKPPTQEERREFSAPRTRAEFLKRAHEAAASGDHDTANALKVRAMHAPDHVARELLDSAGEQEDPATGDRLRVEALSVLRGDAPADASSVRKINKKIAKAEAAGDSYAANNLRSQLLHEERRRREFAVDFTPTPEPTTEVTTGGTDHGE